MPSVSQKQHDFMVAVSKNKALAEKYGIDQKVAKEFVKKDQEEGLWQPAPDLDEFDVESVSFEDDEIAALIPDEVKASSRSGWLFRLEGRFAYASDDRGDG